MTETELSFFFLPRNNTLVNTNVKLFEKTGEPINQLKSVKISLCVEVNIWTQEMRDDQCSVSLPVFFLIPQDESVSALPPSLLFYASICSLLCLCVCLSLILVTFTLLSSVFLSDFLLTHSRSSSFFPLLSVSPLVSHRIFLCFILSSLTSSISPSGLLCLLFVSLSRSPPAEDGDVSRHGGYRGAAVGITAATRSESWQRRTGEGKK